MLTKHISTLYFGYAAVAGHLASCPRHGTDIWEATRHTYDSFDGETREITFRFACHECGAVHFESFDRAPSTTETTSASQVGYGSRPEKVGGLWLHPGPRFVYHDERGPEAYYATLTADRPRASGDVAGVVGWHLTKRRAVRWGTGLGLTEHGPVRTLAYEEFTSKRAAATWISEQLADGGQR